MALGQYFHSMLGTGVGGGVTVGVAGDGVKVGRETVGEGAGVVVLVEVSEGQGVLLGAIVGEGMLHADTTPPTAMATSSKGMDLTFIRILPVRLLFAGAWI